MTKHHYEIQVKCGKEWLVDNYYSGNTNGEESINKKEAISSFNRAKIDDRYDPDCSSIRLVKITTTITEEVITEAKLPKSRYANL